MSQIEILIIGAGPVGLTIGCELARRSIPFRLIECLPTPHQGSRAKGVQPRTLEIFNDLGIAEELLNEGHTELPFRKYSGNQLIGESPRITYDREDTRFPKTLLLPQYKVEEALRKRLAVLGGHIEWSTELFDFVQNDDYIQCSIKMPDGNEEFECRYLVACDGGKSPIRKKLGIKFEGQTHQHEQLWVGDVELKGLKPDAWYNWISPEFGLSLALFPFKNSKNWQLQAVMKPDAAGNIPEPSLDGFNALVRERTQMEELVLTASTWQSIYRVNIRRANQYRVGNAFIAGDACHVHSIAGGMGMNTGIQDAYNLGWKLAAVINEQANDTLLDTYSEERLPIAEWLLETTSERQKTLLKTSTSGKGGMETLASKNGTQLDLNYRNSSLTLSGLQTGNALQAGERAPDVKLANGKWLSDQMKGTEWKLLLFSDSKVKLGIPVKTIEVTDQAIVRSYGTKDGFILIRPDGYIALITFDMNDVHSYINKLNFLN